MIEMSTFSISFIDRKGIIAALAESALRSAPE